MKRRTGGFTPKQWAYANRKLNGQGRSKKEIAILSGFSPSVASNALYKIESTEGYNNALLGLAQESGDVLLAIIQEFKLRGLDSLDNKELIAATHAIASAWDKIEERRSPSKTKDPEQNPLRRMVLERVEKSSTTTRVIAEESAPASSPVKEAVVSDDDDF